MTKPAPASAEVQAVHEIEGVPHRRCLATGEVKPTSALVRFVVAPDGVLVADIAGRLPGRGLWVSAQRAAVELAEKKRLFAKAARCAVSVPASLADDLEARLARQALNLLGLARSAGLVTFGADKVAAALQAGRLIALIEAADGSPREHARVRSAGKGTIHTIVRCFSVEELDLALGRENVVHAGLSEGRLSARFLEEVGRLGGFRDAVAEAEA